MTGAAAEPASGAALLEVRDLQIWAEAGRDRRSIVSGVDLVVRGGETLGIVGESGSGKSMMAKAIAGVLPEGVTATGSVRYAGTELFGLRERNRAKLRGRDIGMVLQDPFTVLNPLLRVGTQILESVRDSNGRRLRGPAAREEAERRLSEVDITDPSVVDRYPFQLSGGMRQRAAIAAALAAEPKILIADEPATALDVTTQKQILDLLSSLQRSRGMALILITHDLRVAFSECHRVAVMYAGRLLEETTAQRMAATPGHPYTLGLLLSEPDLEHRVTTLAAMPGSVPRLSDVAGICAFAPRCQWAQDECTASEPPLRDIGAGHVSACVRVDSISDKMARLRHKRDVVPVEPPRADAASAAPILTVRELSKSFRGSRQHGDVHAVEDVSISVDAGESVGIVGGSGSGKTTLARCVVGLEEPTSGSIEIDGIAASGRDVNRADRRRLLRAVQMVFQDPYSSLNPRRSVGYTLAEALGLASPAPSDPKKAVGELLERVGLPARYAARRPARLSGGERQRIAIARALAVQPKLLVCDEPVSALDVSVQAQILNLLNELRTELGLAYLFITHDLAVVRQVVDRVYVMQSGRLVEAGQIEKVLSEPQHAYTQRLIASIPRATSLAPSTTPE